MGLETLHTVQRHENGTNKFLSKTKTIKSFLRGPSC